MQPYGVGTIDQALLSVMRVKHHFLRSFGLAGKVVILDEVHSYDVYTGTLLDELVASLLAMNCSVIILSATLTKQRKASFLPTGRVFRGKVSAHHFFRPRRRSVGERRPRRLPKNRFWFRSRPWIIPR